jgi:hypothetical protein
MLRGETSYPDPPPQPPEQWRVQGSGFRIERLHADNEWMPNELVAHATSDAPLDEPLPLELDPAAQDPAGAVLLSEPGVKAPHVHPSEAAPLDDLWLLPKMLRPSGYSRHQGEGEPLLGASWLNRPYYLGFFLGALHGDTLIPGEINQSIGFFGGVRLGWDYDTYWGLETRVGFSELGLDFIDESSVDGLSTDVVVWDASLVYYPWGDSRWRPYLSLGLGLVDYDFLDELGLRHSDAVVGLPWGVGLKYRQSDWITMRFDLLDNVAFGGKAGFETMNNLSLTGGLEFRFGGTRKSYFPWNPSRTIR